MDWSDVDYCDVFISCLDSHSDGTHALQRIHFWASDAMLHFSKSVLMKKLIYILVGHFKHIQNPFKSVKTFLFYSEAPIFNNNIQMHLDFSNCSWFLYSSMSGYNYLFHS